MRTADRRIMGRGTTGLWSVLFVIWVAANSSFDPVVLVLGLAITGGIAIALTRTPTVWDGLRAGPQPILSVLRFTGIFLREVVRSNLAMLRIVYAPRIDIRPGITPTRVRLASPMGRFVLANTVTLTPGSLVMDLENDTLTVHALDLATTDVDANTAAVSGPFEPTLARAFG